MVLFFKCISTVYQQFKTLKCAWANRKRCEPYPFFWSGKWLCAIGEKQDAVVFSGLLLLTSFASSPFQGIGSLVHLASLSSPKANEHNSKKIKEGALLRHPLEDQTSYLKLRFK